MATCESNKLPGALSSQSLLHIRRSALPPVHALALYESCEENVCFPVAGHLSERGAYCALPTHRTLECTQRITRVAGAPRRAHAPRVAHVLPFATLRVHVLCTAARHLRRGSPPLAMFRVSRTSATAALQPREGGAFGASLRTRSVGADSVATPSRMHLLCVAHDIHCLCLSLLRGSGAILRALRL
ncbi:hypothetical protein B0H15DRAFT_945866 [Mycena belliarum]|uniref:Uncharacterized protein n=1 Tax=Mycena belliarum TaxID=1033014 RepID=A0AAD6UBG6_9AGAR|nr:hypothetical protein B0H15DRAFT_945866 [Mycena belliae]